jgi:hypothetical protein
MIPLTLFSTDGCHLCEEAQTLLVEYMAAHPNLVFRLDRIEIADHPQLLERYGTSIPVARNEASGIELSWPFTADDLPILFQASH